jgi:hypothetical protein
MANKTSDMLFQLIHSLEKAEKRHFKLYIKRSSSNEHLKVVQLFDVVDKMKDYDEKILLKKLPEIKKEQLSNLKAHLYRQVLASLRLLNSSGSVDLQLNEQFDHAHILYKKGLFAQSLTIIEKAKEMALAYQKMNFLHQLISLEKRIESLHITRSCNNKAEQLAEEALVVSRHIDNVSKLSNLALQLYSWFIKVGHARNEEDEQGIKDFMRASLPADAFKQNGFYERLYLFESFSWYAFIRLDFLMYYRYSRKWIDLFNEHPLMKRVETGHYIKGMHNLLNAYFDLKSISKFDETLEDLIAFSKTQRVQENENFRVQCFYYITQSKLNRHAAAGTFEEGLSLVPQITAQLADDAMFIDPHRILVLNYKIASLYFGNADYNHCIDYLQKIINDKVDLRYDLQCYARLMQLLAHYELGNYQLVEHLARSVYRFMAKMSHLRLVDTEILKFLRNSFHVSRQTFKPELEKFLTRNQYLENNRFETRTFAYLDILSWVRSKVENKSMSEIVREKFEENLERFEQRSRSKNLTDKIIVHPAFEAQR